MIGMAEYRTMTNLNHISFAALSRHFGGWDKFVEAYLADEFDEDLSAAINQDMGVWALPMIGRILYRKLSVLEKRLDTLMESPISATPTLAPLDNTECAKS